LNKPLFRFFMMIPIILVVLLNFCGNLEASVRIIKSDENGLNLIFSVGEYSLSKEMIQGKSYDRIETRSSFFSPQEGLPDLPFYYFFLAIPPSGINIKERIDGVDKMSDVQIPPMGELNGWDEERRACFNPELFDGGKYYPEKVVEVVEKGFIRDIYIAKVAVYPFRWKKETKELLCYADINIEIASNEPLLFTQKQRDNLTSPFRKLLGELLLNYEVIERGMAEDDGLGKRRWLSAGSHKSPGDDKDNVFEGRGLRWKIPINETGVYRITGQELKDFGIEIDNLEPANLRMTNLVWEVPYKFSGYDSFSVDDYIEFFGSALDIVYTDTNVYWLAEEGVPGKRLNSESGAVSGNFAVPDKYFKANHFEKNEALWEVIPNRLTDDNWQWRKLTAEESYSFECELRNLAGGEGNCYLRVELGGFSSLAEYNPDHHTRIELNGKVIGDFTWDGNEKRLFEATISQSDLKEGINIIRITEVGDLDLGLFGPDIIYVNWIEIDSWHTFDAYDDELFLQPRLEGEYEFRIGGFSESSIYVYDITDPLNPIEISDLSVAEEGDKFQVSFEREVGYNSHFYILTESKIKSVPDMMSYESSNIKDVSNKADYLIITHEVFYDSILPLADYRRSEGLNVATIKIGDIYDEFSYGIFYPPAIQSFLQYAYESWARPSPTYVLLVGDGSSHYRNYADLPNKNYIPPYLMYFELFSMTPADNFYACVSGDDFFPDMFLGRIPAQTVGDVEAYIDKVRNYEGNKPVGGWNKNIALISGRGETLVPFREIIEELSDKLPEFYNPQIIDFVEYHESGRMSQLTSDIIDTFNDGCLLVNYVGHGNMTSWSDGALDNGDISSLDNGNRLHFFVTLTCLNGYFPHPKEKRCLAEELLLQGDKGAIACWSPAGFASVFEEQVLNNSLFENLFTKGMTEIGLLTTMTKLSTPGYESLIQSMTLFGDPALSLQVPDYEPSTPTFEMVTNQPYYRQGDNLQIFIRIFNDSKDSYDVDLVVVLRLEDTFLFYPDWGFDERRTRVSVPPESHESLTVLNTKVTGDIPLGEYPFYSAILDVGSYDLLDGIKAVKVIITE